MRCCENCKHAEFNNEDKTKCLLLSKNNNLQNNTDNLEIYVYIDADIYELFSVSFMVNKKFGCNLHDSKQ